MFSPSLRPSTNSLFAPAGGGHQGPRGSRENPESAPQALVLGDDSESGAATASSNALANSGGGGGGGVEAGTSAIEAGAVLSGRRDGALAAAPGGAAGGTTLGGVSSSPATARGAVSSPQDKDFVEEVRRVPCSDQGGILRPTAYHQTDIIPMHERERERERERDAPLSMNSWLRVRF